MNKLIIIVALSVLIPIFVQAQLNVGGIPYSIKKGWENFDVPEKVMPKITQKFIDDYIMESERKGLPFQFGYPHGSDINLVNTGTWKQLDNGDRIWRLKITCPNALSVNLTYDDFWLPPKATFYIYSSEEIIGGFTQRNNKGRKEEKKGFGTAIIKGESITLEYYEPKEVHGEGRISIDRIVHGFRGIDADISDATKNMDCLININCSQGNNWQFTKRTVARILTGSGLCSGALVNAIGNDFIPYFLTANHCLGGLDVGGNTDANNWVFDWNFEGANCNSSSAVSNHKTVGAKLIANLQNTDFALFRLIEDPVEVDNLNPVYAGWTTRTDASDLSSGVGIHHPGGQIKKISIESNPVASAGYSINWDDGTTTSPNTHWEVHFNEGATRGGSSGSPFFNANHQIIGQLHGGSGSCPGDDPFVDWYGRFDISWNGHSSRNRRLNDFLDAACLQHRDLTGNLSGEQPVARANTIQASTSINNNTFVYYSAGEYIDLVDGFDAQVGSDFTAKIGQGCTTNRKDDSEVSSISTMTRDGQLISPHTKKESVTMRVDDGVNDLERDNYWLQQNQPNPFISKTEINYRILTDANEALLFVTNLQGELIKAYPLTNLEQGVISIQGDNYSSGMYYYSLKVDGKIVDNKKMILIK